MQKKKNISVQSPHSDYVTRCYYNVLSRIVITAGSLNISDRDVTAKPGTRDPTVPNAKTRDRVSADPGQSHPIPGFSSPHSIYIFFKNMWWFQVLHKAKALLYIASANLKWCFHLCFLKITDYSLQSVEYELTIFLNGKVGRSGGSRVLP